MVLITPITEPEEGAVFTGDNIKMKIGDKMVGTGTLYVGQYSLDWQPVDRPEGISITWKQIGVHGVSSNPTSIYLIVNDKLSWPGVYEAPIAMGGGGNGNQAEGMEQDPNGSDDEDEGNGDMGDYCDDDEDSPITEFWLIPDNGQNIEDIFRSMNDCQALHPDTDESQSTDSDMYDNEDDNVDDDDDQAGPEGTDEAQNGMRALSLNDPRFETD